MSRLYVSISAISFVCLSLSCGSSNQSKPDNVAEASRAGGTAKGPGATAVGGRSSSGTTNEPTVIGGTMASPGGAKGSASEGPTGGRSENPAENGGSGNPAAGSGAAKATSHGAKTTSGGTKATSGGAVSGSGGTTLNIGSGTVNAGAPNPSSSRSQGGAAGGAVLAGGSKAVSSSDPLRPEDFTDSVGAASIDMVYVPGGTFTLGCESEPCEADTIPVPNITVSPYHIMKNEASKAMWDALGLEEGTWYDCMAFACELGKKTGRAYRMMTEAEFEYAAKNHLSSLSQIDGTEEWAFNSWETKYSCMPGDVDPIGPSPGAHTQKTRRDKATGDNITGRRIRSIDGIGPKCRLTISDNTQYPPGYPAPCVHHTVVCCDVSENSYRDPKWVTGSKSMWTRATIGAGEFELQTWDDGTATLNGQEGQWFTSNNIAFVFIPTSGPLIKFPYILLDANQGAVISDAGFMSGYIGRIEKKSVTELAKPTLAVLKSGAELAAAAGDEYKMVDMVTIPDSAKKQDPRLIDTMSDCWFQNNINAGGTHNYRQDVDADEFRFAVIDQGKITTLANGKWFTVNNTFLRITHPTGYTTDYLYALSPEGYLFHLSFQAYERADFRMFQKYDNAGGKFPPTCINDSCSKELAKGAAPPSYANQEAGKSTFAPAPCPAGGCK